MARLNKLSNKRGFTLVELLVYVALLSVVILLMVQFVLNVIQSTARLDIKEEVHKNAASILRSFEYIARDSSAIYVPTSDFVSDPGQLSLVTNLNLVSGEDEGYADFYVDEGRFCIKEELQGVRCVTSSRITVTSLQFTKINEGVGIESVRIRASLRFDSPLIKYQFEDTVQTTVRLRKY